MNCKKDSFTDYEEEHENGWHLLVWNKETKKIAERFKYIMINKIKMENITTTALKYLKEEGFLQNVDPQNILKYEITLLYYHNKKLESRYIMKYNDKISAIDGFYNGWEYTVKNKNGKFETFDKNYNYLKAYKLPIIIFIIQLLCIISTHNSPNNDLLNRIVAFLMYYSALVYSTFTILVKDLIKPHYLNDNLTRIIWSILIFEIPIITGLLTTAAKVNLIIGKGETFDWLFWGSVALILVKIVFTIGLEIEKKHK
ncbi:hypothetical protein CN300_02625 [Bacillus thuringiensis]|uniref:hypothetical protein n=1 Tax=Bacillus thuringiensis TaxID=1428 RepID=UPI000BED877F|nr:hypothetical protein [Bacillus thuringiensis]PEC13031.1 hypothetical protein CON19_30960 [Bacillus thuringiensis]PEV09252.1 hypothetical protein CN418_23595 [Bacillus thuringiensis]PEY72895.1 hypothetical protein CN355_13135 [Bacillus thuringiensis]PFC49341.1 hypothetical protein CN300_02625 [Bacillus thuringiensis]PGV67391.1 hypothetical protein COD96_18705 [Bacillus thuringiensis]